MTCGREKQERKKREATTVCRPSLVFSVQAGLRRHGRATTVQTTTKNGGEENREQCGFGMQSDHWPPPENQHSKFCLSGCAHSGQIESNRSSHNTSRPAIDRIPFCTPNRWVNPLLICRLRPLAVSAINIVARIASGRRLFRLVSATDFSYLCPYRSSCNASNVHISLLKDCSRSETIRIAGNSHPGSCRCTCRRSDRCGAAWIRCRCGSPSPCGRNRNRASCTNSSAASNPVGQMGYPFFAQTRIRSHGGSGWRYPGPDRGNEVRAASG